MTLYIVSTLLVTHELVKNNGAHILKSAKGFQISNRSNFSFSVFCVLNTIMTTAPVTEKSTSKNVYSSTHSMLDLLFFAIDVVAMFDMI